MNIKNNSFRPSLLTALLTFIMMVPHYFYFIFYPNKYSTSLGGDGLVTYYQMIFHARYGKGTHLTSMNYPEGEFIFLTDGNGIFAILFNYFSTYIYDITDIIPGVYTSIVLLGFIMAAVFMFHLLKTFHIHDYIAVIAAPIIILLSPQILRFVPHYSQAFPFIIPLALLWFIRKTRVLKYEKRDIAFWIIYLMMFLNNSYMGAISLGIALASGMFYIILIKNKAVAISLLKTVILPIILIVGTTFLILKLNDPYTDRLKLQWGFFAFNAEISGFFYPEYSFLHWVIEHFKELKPRGIERAINLGLIPIFTILIYLISKLFKKSNIGFKLNTHSKAILYGSLLMFVFASNSNYLPFLQDIGDKYFGQLLMFKASGRFAWPVYFIVAIITCQLLSAYLEKWRAKGSKWAFVIITGILSLWYLESNWLLNQEFLENKHNNPFTHDTYRDLEKISLEKEINLDNYQAMFMVPLVQAWHDNLITRNNFWSEYTGILLSSITGIPMINGKLSRNSTSITFRSTQMVSSPLIKRGIVDSLPSEKPILLVLGKEDFPLKEGEKFLIDIASPIYQGEYYNFFSLSLDTLRASEEYYNAVSKVKQGTTTLPTRGYVEDHFDDDMVSLYGETATELPAAQYEVFKEFSVECQENAWYLFSIWNLEKADKYGSIEWFIEVKNGDYNEKVKSIARENRDIYGSWIRSTRGMTLRAGKNDITITYSTRIPMVVDEFLFHEVRDTIIYKDPLEERVLYNGYILDIE